MPCGRVSRSRHRLEPQSLRSGHRHIDLPRGAGGARALWPWAVLASRGGGSGGRGLMSRRSLHLIDASAATSFFRSIAKRHDRVDFSVTIGSIAPCGKLQTAMDELGVATFSLDARRRQYLAALVRLVTVIRRHRV